jgi:glycogen operon protein
MGTGGVNVAVFSRNALHIDFCLFDDDDRPLGSTRLVSRTGDVHHGFVAGVTEGMRYGLRAHGPFDPERGLRFDPDKVLVDPYATRLAPYPGTRDPLSSAGGDDLVRDGLDTAPFVPKAVIEKKIASSAARPERPSPSNRVIYEVHARGFSMRHPGIPQELRGTFAALAHPASLMHLKRLGITTLEVMPLTAAWDERHLAPLGLSNYWGYNPIAFLAPDPRLVPGGMQEIASTVDALHDAGLEVILDVVFNHTAESDERGRTLSLRGLDNLTYYRLADNPRQYVNDTGCGNTLALDRPIPIRLVMDSLRHWAEVGGFDGFRFDLAPVLGRTVAGFSVDAPLIAAIEQDPVLRDRVMIAEPWDVGSGGYQSGAFPSRWLEWNDRSRDDFRRFWRGDGSIGAFATRLAGSSDVFEERNRRPSSSVNFVSAHDGFTLRDCLSFEHKCNEANGEGNRDGHSGEISFVSPDPKAHCRALVATVLLARGTPMLAAGDEFGRSQAGNNNAYAQNNPTTWLDWAQADEKLIDFTAQMIATRLRTPALLEDRFLKGDGDVQWLRADGCPFEPRDWDKNTRLIGMHLVARWSKSQTVVWFNGAAEPVEASMPAAPPGCVWHGGEAEDVAPFDLVLVPGRSVALYVDRPGMAVPRRTGVPDAIVHHLAEQAGIVGEWWQVNGSHTRVSLETKRWLLESLGFPAASASEAIDSLYRLEKAVALTPPVSTRQAFFPDPLGRHIGLSVQLYAMRRDDDQGIGDFTTLRLIAASAAARGIGTIALNPFHAGFPSDRGRASPYQPSDRRFLDAMMIDVDAVPEIGAARSYLSAQGGEIAALRARRDIDHASVWRIKSEALRQAFAVFCLAGGQRKEAFARFKLDGGDDLARFCLFQALEAEAGTPPRTLPARIPRHLTSAIDFAAWLQFLADEQLAHASKEGLAIGLYRDLAVGPARDGAEVIATPGAFLEGVSVGAPPDPFSSTGQVWNLPPFDPIALIAGDFAPWRKLLRANMRHAGALRIDHAMALRRLFLIPEGASPADGAYVRYPMEGMLDVLAEESQQARCIVVGEDLGTVPDGFRERLASAAVFSYRVLLFERDEQGFLPPQAYPERAVACVSTHDLPPLAGWWRAADLLLDRELGRHVDQQSHPTRAKDRSAVARFAGKPDGPLTADLSAAIHGTLAKAPAAIALVQAEELVGEADPVNVPGTTESEYPNWRRRLATGAEQLFETDEALAIVSAMQRERPERGV